MDLKCLDLCLGSDFCFKFRKCLSLLHNNKFDFSFLFQRQHELRDPALRDDLAAARAILKKHHAMLLTASKAYVRHPELSAAKANRDFVMRQVCTKFILIA